MLCTVCVLMFIRADAVHGWLCYVLCMCSCSYRLMLFMVVCVMYRVCAYVHKYVLMFLRADAVRVVCVMYCVCAHVRKG